jgi:hypothetical protein
MPDMAHCGAVIVIYTLAGEPLRKNRRAFRVPDQSHRLPGGLSPETRFHGQLHTTPTSRVHLDPLINTRTVYAEGIF